MKPLAGHHLQAPVVRTPVIFSTLLLCIYGTWPVLSFFGTTLWAQGTLQPQKEPIRAEVNLVTVRFTVKDPQGRFMNTLTRDRFECFEGRVPRKIGFFEPPRNVDGKVDQLWLAFLVDVSGSTFSTRSEEIIAAQTFLDNVHNFTQVGIFGFTDKLLPFQPFTASREAALRAFGSARQHLGQTAIYDSLETLISRMKSQGASGDRKVIIVISDGMDNAYYKADRVIKSARLENVKLYTILVPSAAQLYIGPASANSKNRTSGDQERKEAGFTRLSQETAGKHFGGLEAILDFDETLAVINDDIFGNLYSIGYYTDNPHQEKQERNVRVDVDVPEARVSSLFKNLPERSLAKKRFIAALFDDAARWQLPKNAQTHFREIGAEIDLLIPRREGGRIGVPFRIKISPYTLRATEKGGVRSQMGVIGVLLDRQGNEVVRLREFFRVDLPPKEIRDGRGIIYTNKLMVPPGVYDLRIALLEIATWKMTAFEDVVRVVE